ncbi:MAG: DNA mismatch repair endonuclease MutL [Deltaproteobacteria bacterium]|nr:DNA mismatch repair endonuclease MutL [Deltaproteobacteria bacterium]
MTTKIRVLDSELIDRIAAGEVVERPASVAKELIENSLDAGASRIVCRVEEGGRALVRVTDDGSGMGREDLALCVLRHATSKIGTFEDLQRLGTLGFRGEALPSIAAVSRFRIVTRRRQDEAGLELVSEGGKTAAIREIGAPAGTEVEVRDLFFNTPARRKFLRSASTEMSHISAWVTRLGLVRPDVHLRLEHGNRKLIDAPPSSDPHQRTALLLGRQVYEHLHPIDHQERGLRIRGQLSDPGGSRHNTRAVYLFVNGRYVRDRLLQHAVMQGYRTVLPEGRFPVVVLQLEIDPECVDVNVHPQKTEVRFSDARHVQRALTASIAEVLAATPWAITKGAARTYVIRSRAPAGVQESEHADRVREALARYDRSPHAVDRWTARAPMAMAAWAAHELVHSADLDRSDGGRPLVEIPIVGTLWRTYIVLASEDRLVIVDQHAAHERVTFERLRASLDAGVVRSQRLLVPVQLELDAEAMAAAEEHGERLADMGFDLEPFGPGIIVVKSIPALLAQAPVLDLVRDVLDELSDTGDDSAWQQRRIGVLSRMACHASVRAGRELGEAEIRSLLVEVERVDFGALCPHGRPVFAEFSRREVERWFHRG